MVTMPPPGAEALVVPSNERLCGTQFAHFPVGGPTPAAKHIGQRESPATEAQRMLYQCESVDGVAAGVWQRCLAAFALIGLAFVSSGFAFDVWRL